MPWNSASFEVGDARFDNSILLPLFYLRKSNTSPALVLVQGRGLMKART